MTRDHAVFLRGQVEECPGLGPLDIDDDLGAVMQPR